VKLIGQIRQERQEKRRAVGKKRKRELRGSVGNRLGMRLKVRAAGIHLATLGSRGLHQYHTCTHSVRQVCKINLELASKCAVILMDLTSPHISERVQGFGGKSNHGHHVPGADHNFFQALGFVLFGATKNIKKIVRDDFGDNSVRDQITELLQVYERVGRNIVHNL
jgi:hypothetical protein